MSGMSYATPVNLSEAREESGWPAPTFHASSKPQLRTQCAPGASTESTIRWHTLFHMSSPFTLSQSLPSSSYRLQTSRQMTAALPSLMAWPSSGKPCRRVTMSVHPPNNNNNNNNQVSAVDSTRQCGYK